ncbi:branched-chain amino acid aminotransferase [Sesbania bispinosa]|nr:branched-chain amino acid aminotransferase [Sesbania bispinosa]
MAKTTTKIRSSVGNDRDDDANGGLTVVGAVARDGVSSCEATAKCRVLRWDDGGSQGGMVMEILGGLVLREN